MDREQEEAEKILIVMPKKSEKCPGCKMGIDQPYRNKNPKYESNLIMPNALTLN